MKELLFTSDASHDFPERIADYLVQHVQGTALNKSVPLPYATSLRDAVACIAAI